MVCHLQTLSLSYQQVVIVVTNHFDENMGDMFLGADETGQGHAAKVDQVHHFYFSAPESR